MPGTRSTRSASKHGAAQLAPAVQPPPKNPRTKPKFQIKAEPVLEDELADEFDTAEDQTEVENIEIKKEITLKLEELPRSPSPKVAIIDETQYAKISNHDKATDGKCGHCDGCVRSPCHECSACKRQLFGECIDLYCTNERSGITERVNLREMYLKTLKVQKEIQIRQSSGEDSSTEDDADGEENQEKHDSEETVANKSSEFPQKKPKNFNTSVYGGSSRALKSRRCGECEGCTKDDCGTCPACLDKPRFGGKGTKKKACSERYCRLKTLY